jgi:hypothetical protein
MPMPTTEHLIAVARFIQNEKAKARTRQPEGLGQRFRSRFPTLTTSIGETAANKFLDAINQADKNLAAGLLEETGRDLAVKQASRKFLKTMCDLENPADIHPESRLDKWINRMEMAHAQAAGPPHEATSKHTPTHGGG